MILPSVLASPLITPAKVVLAFEIVSVFAPKRTEPALVPAKVVTVAPEVVPLISNIALSVRLDELAIEPAPVSARIPPEMVVAPV